MDPTERAKAFFDFEAVDARLDAMPIAARRALEESGFRLTQAQWTALDPGARMQLVALGTAERVVRDQVGQLLSAQGIDAPARLPAAADSPPARLLDALGPSRPLPDAIWSALRPLDRFALLEVASSPERLALAYAELVGASALSSHLQPSGEARMVDVAGKAVTLRRAVASSRVRMSASTLQGLSAAPKGDVLAAARIAGIMAAKKTADLIPLCHPIATTSVRVELEPAADRSAILITATAETLDRTGVEMEAMVAASVAALTVYDMLKGVERGMTIEQVRLEMKEGGRSGTWLRDS